MSTGHPEILQHDDLVHWSKIFFVIDVAFEASHAKWDIFPFNKHTVFGSQQAFDQIHFEQFEVYFKALPARTRLPDGIRLYNSTIILGLQALEA